MSDSSLARTQEEGAASGCGDDEDDVQRRIWPARRHDDFREGPLVGWLRAIPLARPGNDPAYDLADALELVAGCDRPCRSRTASVTPEHDQEPGADELEGEWLSYAALLVQVDRIVGDLSAPPPT